MDMKKETNQPIIVQGNAGMPPLGDSWDDLPQEVFGVVGRNLSPFAREMMRFLLCVGPDTANIVRTKFLTGNEAHLIESAYDRRGLEGETALRCGAKAAQFISCWMQCNDWKTRCLGAKSSKNVGILSLPPEYAKVILLESSGSRNAFNINFDLDVSECSDLEFGREYLGALMLKSADIETIFQSVGTEVIRENKSSEEMQELIQSAPPGEDGKITIRYLRSNTTIFSDPENIILLGLDEVLRYHVEEGITSADDFVSTAQVRLLAFAAVTADFCGMSCFKYLLTAANIKLVAATRNGDDTSYLHLCAYSKISIEVFTLIVQHPGVDANKLNNVGRTVLHCLVFRPYKEAPAKLEIWLQNGGDQGIVDPDGWVAYDYIMRAIELEKSNSHSVSDNEDDSDEESVHFSKEEIQILEEMLEILDEDANVTAICNLFI